MASIVPARSLFQELRPMTQVSDKFYEAFDVNNLVANSQVSRVDLRRIAETDDEIGQCIETRLDKLLSVDWRIEHKNKKITQFLTEQTKRHYSALVTNAFNARLYGYDVMERLYAKEDGYLVVESILQRPFEWFGVTRKGELTFSQVNSVNATMLDKHFKFLLTVNGATYHNPRGKALLAYLFWPWFYRSAVWQFWLQFLEKAGMPMLLGKGNDPKAIAEQLALAYQDATIAVPTDVDVKVLESTNRGQSFETAEDKLVRRMQKIILGQTLTSDIGSNGNGSRALGDVHNDVRADKTLSDIKLITPTIQNYVTALCALNFPNQDIANIVYSADKDLETARATRDAALMNTKKITLTEQYFIREYGYQIGDIVVDMSTATGQVDPAPTPDPLTE